MKRALLLRPEAEHDLVEARTWYELKSPGLGSDFLVCIDAALSSLQRTPELYSSVHKNVRRMLTRRFPYGIFYVVEERRIVVIAVMHVRRDPKTWHRRT